MPIVESAEGHATDGDARGRDRLSGRVRLFDVVRGFSVLSMALFHFCYDLRYIAGLPLPWFQGAFQDVWRATISWTFLFLAGVMGSYSRSNYRRAAKYGLFALAIYAVTSAAAVDDAISFGIIYCMAASTLVLALLSSAGLAPRGASAALACLVAFLLLLHLPTGQVGMGPLSTSLPRGLYQTPWLSWLGFPGPGFVSGDYYPLLPYLLMYLTGAALGPAIRRLASEGRLPGIACRPLEWLGRHALLVYAAHQPLLLVVASLVTGRSLL